VASHRNDLHKTELIARERAIDQRGEGSTRKETGGCLAPAKGSWQR
jgi:hypothetical protein